MDYLFTTIHLTHDCDFCGETNELTAAGLLPSEPVSCSLCGNPLGTIGEMVDQEADGEIEIMKEAA